MIKSICEQIEVTCITAKNLYEVLEKCNDIDTVDMLKGDVGAILASAIN